MKKHQNVELDQPTPPKFQFDDMELQLKQRARRNFSEKWNTNNAAKPYSVTFTGHE